MDSQEIRFGAIKCRLCRDPLKGADYGTTIIGAVIGGVLCTVAFNGVFGGVVGAIAGGVLGRIVQKYLDTQRKLMKDMSEAKLSLSELERKRELEADRAKR